MVFFPSSYCVSYHQENPLSRDDCPGSSTPYKDLVFPVFWIALLSRSPSPSSWFPHKVIWLFLVQLQNQGAHFQCSRGSKARCLSKTLEHLSGQRKPLAESLREEPEGTLPSSLQCASSFYRGRQEPREGRCVALSHIASHWLEPWSPGLWLWFLLFLVQNSLGYSVAED